MEYDYYKLYLGTDMDNYVICIPCDTLDKVEYELNRAELYDKYLVIGHVISQDLDEPVASGRVEVNRTHKKKGR